MSETAAKGKDLKEYSMEEVQKNCEPEKLWMVVGNRILDVTEFDDHPGGPDVLEGVGGTDATVEFEQIAHSGSAKKQVEDYVIGKLKGTEITDLFEGDEDGLGESSVIFTVIAIILAVAAYFYLK